MIHLQELNTIRILIGDIRSFGYLHLTVAVMLRLRELGFIGTFDIRFDARKDLDLCEEIKKQFPTCKDSILQESNNFILNDPLIGDYCINSVGNHTQSPPSTDLVIDIEGFQKDDPRFTGLVENYIYLKPSNWSESLVNGHSLCTLSRLKVVNPDVEPCEQVKYIASLKDKFHLHILAQANSKKVLKLAAVYKCRAKKFSKPVLILCLSPVSKVSNLPQIDLTTRIENIENIDTLLKEEVSWSNVEPLTYASYLYLLTCGDLAPVVDDPFSIAFLEQQGAPYLRETREIKQTPTFNNSPDLHFNSLFDQVGVSYFYDLCAYINCTARDNFTPKMKYYHSVREVIYNGYPEIIEEALSRVNIFCKLTTPCLKQALRSLAENKSPDAVVATSDATHLAYSFFAPTIPASLSSGFGCIARP